MASVVEKIISGAQTGADRAGLDAGLALGLQVGGWIPAGRRTDEGSLPIEDFNRYNLREHSSPAYPPRTEANVLDSDGTVIFGSPYSPGCSLTARLCKKHKKPCLIMEHSGYSQAELLKWLLNNTIKVLNVAGNRERTNRGIYKLTYNILVRALADDDITSKLERA